MILQAAPSQAMTIAGQIVLLLMLISDSVILGVWLSYRRRCRLAIERPLAPGDDTGWPESQGERPDDADTSEAIEPPARESAAQVSLSDGDERAEPDPGMPNFDLSATEQEALGASNMPKPPFAARWSAVHWYLGVQAAIVIITVLVMPLMLPLFLFNPNAAADPNAVQAYLQQPWMTVALLVIQNIVFIGLPLWVFRLYGASLRSVGLGRPNWRLLCLGLLFGVGLLVFSNYLDAFVTELYRFALGAARFHALERAASSVDAGAMTKSMKSFPMRLAMALVGSIAVPIGEELLFRGWLYNCIKRRWNPGVGMVVSGLVFGAAHFNPIASPAIVVMGVLLAWAYESTGSLYVTMMMHGINNGVSFIVLLVPHSR
ncbi:MAG: CPBP family intramembrane metalloprotease [Armatimonadetes bacterium]|nr:CPBP family intramembrane metalloprotease [Armatimonadota bacterium]MDE2207609.1 CPBP family intramembrane metalloprotease [Armatimonadota bacterium]